MEQLKVGIGADTKGLEKGLKDAEKALSTFATRSKQIEAQLKNNAIESSKLGAEISKLELDYKKGTISQSDFGKGMLKLTNAEKTLSNESKVLRNDLAKLNASTRDLGTKGMRVNAISAGPIKTLAASAIGDAKFLYKWNEDHSFLKRNVDIHDVGNSALYLLSDLANGVTGEIHYVDAGYNKVGMPDPKNIT